MDTLGKIFGNTAKVRLMRLFLFNPKSIFDLEDLSQKTKSSQDTTRKEVKALEESKMIKPRSFLKEVKISNSKSLKVSKKKRTRGWLLNKTFSYIKPLQSFLIYTSLLQDRDIIRRLRNTGNVKLLIISGVFIQEPESRVDLLLVGDGLKKNIIERAIAGIESELGKELTYAFFETKDFNYRLGIYDKLIRDILDYPHKKLINRLGLG